MEQSESKEIIPVHRYLKEIKDGILNVYNLPRLHREECVEALMLEKLTIPGIAHFLKMNEETVIKDVRSFRQKIMEGPEPEYVWQKCHKMYAIIRRSGRRTIEYHQKINPICWDKRPDEWDCF